jgi:hypothetical protein
MFTICVFLFASLNATKPSEYDCREHQSQAQVDAAKATCEAVAKDPLTTCEMVKFATDKWAVNIRKLEGT